MAEGNIEGSPPVRRAYAISNYSDGIYQPNGHFTRESILSEKAIELWNNDNKRIFDGKLWGRGQALFFTDKSLPLVFGRDSNRCDVKIDEDPDSDGIGRPELGVSRRHFEIKFSAADRLVIKDLGSHNGLRIYNIKDRSRTVELGKGSSDSAQLEAGDFVLIGGGGSNELGQQGRLIGFTVCRGEDREIFLVKFNAHNLDDLLAVEGRVEEKPREEIFGENELVKGILGGLVEDLKGVKRFETQGPNSIEALDQTQKYITSVMEACRSLGIKHFSGDWKMAASRIGMMALDMGEEALQEGKKSDSARLLEVSNYMHQIASGGILPRVKDE